MSVVSENLKEAEKKRQIHLQPSRVEIQDRTGTPDHRKFVLLIVLLSMGFAASLFILFVERGLRLQRETELSAKTAELSEKESRVSSLTEQIASLEQSSKARISELEFTLNQLSMSFDSLMGENKSLRTKNVSQQSTIAALSEQTDALRKENARLSEWLLDAKKIMTTKGSTVS